MDLLLGLGIQDPLFVDGMRRRFIRRQKARTERCAVRAKRQRSSEPTAVGESSRRQQRQIGADRITRGRDQGKRSSGSAHMAARLESLHHDHVGAGVFGGNRLCNRAALPAHFHSRLLHLRNMLGGVAPKERDRLDGFLQQGLDHARRKERNQQVASGFFVILRAVEISFWIASGFSPTSANVPSPPASETAPASSASDTPPIAAETIGYSIPNSSVIPVLNIAQPPAIQCFVAFNPEFPYRDPAPAVVGPHRLA